MSSRWTEEEWDEFVNQSPDASGYHDHRWRRVFENAFGHETDYLVARAEEQIVGVLPLVIMRSWLFGRFMVSLPFVNYGGALGDAPAVRALVETAVERCRARRLAYLELRHVSRRFPEYPVRQHKVAMLLALEPNETSMWKRLDHKVRNQVRKAEKSGLRAEAGGAELVADFYDVFAENMRDLGTPVYSRRFFEQMLAQFPGSVETVLVRLGDKAVAGAISYSHHERLEVPWACSLQVPSRDVPQHAAVLDADDARHRRGQDDSSILAAQPLRKAPTTSSGSGAPCRRVCPGSTRIWPAVSFPIKARRIRSSGPASSSGGGCPCRSRRFLALPLSAAFPERARSTSSG